jgi:hypothetical protein
MPAGHPAVDGMPPGHPAMAGSHPTTMPPMGIAPADPNAGQGEAALAWTVPAGWVDEPPSSSMRRAQYRVPAPTGDAECLVFYFGPGQGGDPMSNAQRWASQFADDKGQPATASMKTRSLDVPGSKVLVVEARGTYMAGSMTGGATEARPNQALLGAIAEGPDANWFFKLTGPEATVKAQTPAFEAMLKSLKRGA